MHRTFFSGAAVVRCARLLLLLGLLAVLLRGEAVTAGVGDDTVVVVLNARNPTQRMSRAEVKNLFLGNTAFWNGVVPVKLVIRAPDTSASTVFYGDILGMSAQRFDGHWSSRQLAGQGVAPQKAASPDELARLIRGLPGGVGFMLASEVWDVQPDGVRVLEIQ